MMGEIMQFPETVEEFMQQYKITDTQQVYTNGTELVPIFRMKQWFEAHKQHWIPCSERLPDVDDNYLCAFHFEAGNKNYASTLFFYATDPSPHFQCEDIRLLKVTHWMPLPEPPEEEP